MLEDYNVNTQIDNHVLKKVERRRECWNEKVESRKRRLVEKVLTGKGVGKKPRGRPI